MINLEDENIVENDKNIELTVGLDLSFNSTGITFLTSKNSEAKSIEFHRLVFSTEPKTITNVNQHTYNFPKNINIDDIVDDSDFYSEDQAHITIKCMMCTKRITHLIVNKVSKLKQKFPDYNISVYINIEGFIMSSFTGNTQLRVLGGLIMLQGLVRADLIKMKLASKFKDFKIYITSPSELKLYFTGTGGQAADKQLMLDSFLDTYDGAKLLPDTSSLGKINDVIDSFALMVNCYHRTFHITSYTEWKGEKATKPTTKKKKSKTKPKPEIILHL